MIEQPLLKQHDDRDGGGGGGQPVPGKHIIIGLDGTWQAAFRDSFKSNVHRLNVALNYHDNTWRRSPQIFIYSAGVGTSNLSSRIFAGATGEGLSAIILEAYINLASNYVPGDKIYIFGFSRGAFAARALTSFIQHSGLLRANNLGLIESAWIDYAKKDKAKTAYLEHSAGLTYDNVSIEFLGLWDTVIGSFQEERLISQYRFDNRKPAKKVKTAVHIMSIDDRRTDYKPIPFERRENQTLEQIWMPGVHSDVGGGYGQSFLSTVSLLVMIDKIREYCPDIAFDENYIKNTLIEIVEKEDVIVNYELAGFWGFRAQAARQVPDNDAHTEHPLVEL
ncbi:uncharacterized protein (DUF2235 family) [Bradyrhizobium sp. LA6.10]|uniref:DUF2235 domain-containing protein n=1 Tax=Bradyrhizobium sp. LA6.10 TaxID=3156318 RepID=UPI0033992D00